MRNLVLLCYLHMVHIALPITCMQGHLVISVLNHTVLRLNILSCQDYTNGTVTVGSTGAFNSVLYIIYVSSCQIMRATKWETRLSCLHKPMSALGLLLFDPILVCPSCETNIKHSSIRTDVDIYMTVCYLEMVDDNPSAQDDNKVGMLISKWGCSFSVAWYKVCYTDSTCHAVFVGFKWLYNSWDEICDNSWWNIYLPA